MSRINWDHIIETFVVGTIGTVCLSSLLMVLFVFYTFPIVILFVLGGVGFIFGMGWCMINYENFKGLLHLNPDVLENAQPEISYRIPIIGKLEHFEEKYRMTTVRFMVFVHDCHIPYGMNNLDYLEWISLVNELPSITTSEQGDKRNG